MSKAKKNKTKLSLVEKTLLIISTIIFILIVILLATNKIKVFDDFVYKIVSSTKSDFSTVFFKIMTFFAGLHFILLFILFVMFFCRKHAGYFTINIVGTILINQILKHIVLRPRPAGISLITEDGYSFPSGHSMAAVAFYGFFIYLILNSKITKNKKILFTTLLVIIISLIGISRIYLGVHYASDVLAGFSLSTIYLILLNYFKRKKKS